MMLKGQSFVSPVTGTLSSIQLAICAEIDAALEIRQFNGDDFDWDDGALIGSSANQFSGSGSSGQCLISQNGLSSYEIYTFHFDDVGLVEGQSYVFLFSTGVGLSSCEADYDQGSGFLTSSVPNTDLSFELMMCEDPTITFGCTNTGSCNYDPSASHSDGSCLELDCSGVCGGTSYWDEDCGCLSDEALAGSCIGCLEEGACNFSGIATVSDNSCIFPDCHGDCGGTAVITDCGCIGGLTGFSGEACVNGCLTDVTETGDAGCSPGLMNGQTFTANVTGEFVQVNLMTCCASSAEVTVRKVGSACGSTDPFGGEILGVSNLVSASCSGISNCFTSSGVGGYDWRLFTFNDVIVESGQQYIIELTQGFALASCSTDYIGGSAFYNSNPTGADLAMKLHICAAGIELGCTDPDACFGYSSSATHDDGSCLFLDCAGICGGSAGDGECGCLGGLTGVPSVQCVDGVLQDILKNEGEFCGGTLSGQDILMPEDGFLLIGEIVVDQSMAQTLVVERSDGPLVGQEILTAERAASPMECGDVAQGWGEFEFGQLPLEGGRKYRFRFLSGEAYHTCSSSYADGEGLNSAMNPIDADMAFRLIYRSPQPGELVWGCMDESACNYDALATHDNGSCAALDCHGDCGGAAQFIEGCGCVGGNAPIPLESCYGCTDVLACNYNASAVSDDGSCSFFADCHGDCGGDAVYTQQCGCVGGNTGVSAEGCLELCQGTSSLSTYPEDDSFAISDFGFSQSGQTFIATEGIFLTGTKVRQYSAPDGEISMELRRKDNPFDVKEGTFIAQSTQFSWTDSEGVGGDILMQWPPDVNLEVGEEYVLVLIGAPWQAFRAEDNLYLGGASFNGVQASASLNDLVFELLVCDELYGCTEPNACNYDPWASQENGGCSYPMPLEDCSGNPCVSDADGDGICEPNDIDDLNPFICMDSDGDGCDDCSSGMFDPQSDGPDVDEDGLCDSGDLCSDSEAENYDDPANGPCQGFCDNAPVFLGIQVDTPGTDRWAEDGTFIFAYEEAGFPFVNSLLFEATTLSLTGINGAPDYLFDLSDADYFVQPGWYSATLLNSSGCPGVSMAVHGSTFGQAPVSLPLFMTYSLCCGDCENHDVDNDMICDSEDECTDKHALNYADPANEPCQY